MLKYSKITVCLIWAIYAIIAKNMLDYSKLIVSLIIRLPYRAPYIHNGGDSSFREGPARKNLLKFIYSEKAAKTFEIFTLLLTGTRESKKSGENTYIFTLTCT
jgi:hypothetical protein